MPKVSETPYLCKQWKLRALELIPDPNSEGNEGFNVFSVLKINLRTGWEKQHWQRIGQIDQDWHKNQQ